MFKSTFSNILFTTWYKSNVKNLEIYCQRLKKLLLQHCECAYKHSQTFYDPMNLQKQLLHIVQHWQDMCFIFWPKWYKHKHNRATITSSKENIFKPNSIENFNPILIYDLFPCMCKRKVWFLMDFSMISEARRLTSSFGSNWKILFQ